jgi:hypothetical protein
MPEALGSPKDKGLTYYRIQDHLRPHFFKNIEKKLSEPHPTKQARVPDNC